MTNIQTLVVEPGTPEVSICARWRAREFSVLATNYENELKSLESFTADQTNQVALIAKCDGVPAGTCLLVKSEIEPRHPVSPWLAGLFVTPEYRRLGVGQALVRAIEVQAKSRGNARLYLYTTNAARYYERLGWNVTDRLDWNGFATSLMERDLQG
jgi:predicted N-acetyltransferase YhbS